MDFQSAMETFAEAWVAANAGQQNQALALTRAANAAAAVAAANAKTPPEHHALHSDIVVKKELSLSPSNSRHTPSSINNNNNNNNSNNNNINPQTTSVNITHNQSPPTSTAQQHRRNSLQGVQDKLSQLQQLQSQQQHQHQHHHHHHQQQPQQQKQNHNDAQRSPPYAARVMSAHNTTPSPLNISGEITTTPHPPATSTPMVISSQQCSTPKISERSEDRTETQSIAAQRLMGSITCLPPSALNAAAAAAVSAHHQPASETVSGPTLPVHTHAAAAAAAAAMESQRRSDFDVTKVNSKSLPLHCVVESVHSLQASLNIDNRSPWKRRPNVETDSYVIVAAATPWSEIVHTALQRLGYSQETAATARGSLIIKNWKPIPLEQISENPMIPVCDIIGELTSVVTLRIVIMRCKPSPFGDIKDKLLKLLVLQSHALLRSTGCPLDEVTLSQICRSSYQSPFAFPGGDIPEEMRRKFDQWWSNQLSPQSSMTPKMLPFMAGPPPSVSSDQSLDHSMGTAALAAAAAAAAAAQVNLHAASSVTGNVPANMGPTISSGRDNLMIVENPVHHPPVVQQNSAVAAAAAAHHAANMMVHPVMHAGMHHHHHHPHHPHHPHGNLSAHAQFSNQKTRMRTSFDPEMELPRLQKWFQENPHPSRQQIQTYVVQLNALESRRGRKPLDVNNVVYWFKNARAAQKRAEMRGGLGVMHAAMNGYLTQHSQLGHTSGGSSAGSMGSQQQMMAAGLSNLGLGNDFMKSPLSLKSEDIDTMSQHSDDMEDDTSRPPSPQLPLSLTMHERNQTCTERTQQEDNNNGHQNNNENTMQGPMAEKERNLIERSDGMYGGGERMDLTMPTHENKTTSSDNTDSRMTLDMKEPQVQETQKLNENLYNEQHTTVTERIGESLGVSNNNNSNDNNNTNNNNTTSNSHINNESHQSSMSRANTPKSQYCPKEEEDDLDMDEDDDDNDTSHLDDFRSPSPDMSSAMMAATGAVRKDLPFPIVPNSMFSQSFMYMSHYMPGFGQAAAAAAHPHAAAAAHHAAAAAAAAGLQPNPLMGAGSLNLSNISNEERRKRNRTFIDPVTEVPKLEQWFAMNTHPSHNLILKYTEDLNTMPYRQKFPRLESKNVQFWFKNRRAKCKRLKMSLYDNNPCPQMSNLNSFVHKYDERD